MDNELIPTEVICTHYQVEYQFIQSLHEAGLIQLTTVEHRAFIPPTQLQDLERMIRMHYDLHINLEGIEAIAHLLDRVKLLQKEMTQLRNRLRLYEEDSNTIEHE
ncbi:MAG: MerR family transcriptional regulator [Chitinophagaceae bacterium]